MAAVLMDRAGRRPLLLTSFGGMAACLAALSAFMLLPSERVCREGLFLQHGWLFLQQGGCFRSRVGCSACLPWAGGECAPRQVSKC